MCPSATLDQRFADGAHGGIRAWISNGALDPCAPRRRGFLQTVVLRAGRLGTRGSIVNANVLELRLLALLGAGCTVTQTTPPDVTEQPNVPQPGAVAVESGTLRVLRSPQAWSDVIVGIEDAPVGAEVWVIAGRSRGRSTIRDVRVEIASPTIIARIDVTESSFQVTAAHGQKALTRDLLYFQAVSADGTWSTDVSQNAIEPLSLECGPAMMGNLWVPEEVWGGLNAVVVCDTEPVPGYCPAAEDVGINTAFLESVGLNIPEGVVAGAVCFEPRATSACCYNVQMEYGWDSGTWDTAAIGGGGGGGWSGRPFRVDGEVRVSGVRPTGTAIEAGDCPEALRGDLVRGWMKIGLEEHASVAAFARFTLELMQLGAPLELIQEATAAQLDEVRHTQLAFAMASRFAGEILVPEGLSMQGALDGRDLRAVTLDVVREGCINETISTLIAMEARDHALDADARAAHVTITADETRHAELSWKFVRWALAQPGTEALRAEVLAILRSHAPEVHSAEAPDAAALAHYGVLSDHRRERVACRAQAVIQRCTDALAAC